MAATYPQAELQKALYDLLTTNAAVMAQADGVYDAVPPKPWDGPHNGYISFGAADVTIDDAECITAGLHTIQIDCWSRQVGSVHCKRMVDAVYAAVHEAPPLTMLTVNALAQIQVVLRMVMADPDGLTTHGLLQVEALIEEPAL
jgi:hypothetical protein